MGHAAAGDLSAFVPPQVGDLSDAQTALPRIAKDPAVTALIDAKLRELPTTHTLHLADARGYSHHFIS